MFKLDYICFVKFSGYAQAAKNTVNALLCSNQYDIKLTPLDIDLKNVAKEHIEQYKDLVAKKNDTSRVQIFHCIPDMIRRFKKNFRTVGVGVYETWKPPAHWIAILNQQDAVIVPSKFNETIFREEGITKPIFHIPHCLDMSKYHPGVKPMYEQDRFTFLFLGSWRLRKGYKELLMTWVRYFKVDDGVQLLIKTDKPQAAQEYVREIVKGKTVAPISIDHNKYLDDQMPAFIKSVDCLISPTLGEGFGICGLQAMALGVPVIITNHSGCTEYANAETAFLLQPEGTRYQKCLDGIPQFSRKTWIYLSPEQIGYVMHRVFEHPEEVKQKGNAGSLYARTKFGYNTTIERFKILMEELV